MSILRLFSQKEPAELISGNTVKVAEPVEGQPANEVPINSGANEEAKNQDAVKADSDDRYITIKWGTGEPIDVIYNFIHKNLEDKGYNDALVNSNISYMNGEIDIINNDLKMLFRRIALRYKGLCTEIDVNIEAAEAAFLPPPSRSSMQERKSTQSISTKSRKWKGCWKMKTQECKTW